MEQGQAWVLIEQVDDCGADLMYWQRQVSEWVYVECLAGPARTLRGLSWAAQMAALSSTNVLHWARWNGSRGLETLPSR